MLPVIHQLVTGNLFEQKAIVRFVIVEGPNHIVAVTPGLRDGGIAFATVRVGVADEIHPVAGAVFAEAG